MENEKKTGYHIIDDIVKIEDNKNLLIKFSTKYSMYSSEGKLRVFKQPYSPTFNIFDNINVASGFSTMLLMQGLQQIFLELRDKPLLLDIKYELLDKTIQYFGGKEEFEKMLIFKESYISTNQSPMILILLDMTKYKTQ